MFRFLWARCKVSELKGLQGNRQKDIAYVLNSVSSTLDDSYMRILQRVNTCVSSEVARALWWLSLSMQPLSPEEINEACVINAEDTPIIKDEDRFSGEGVILGLSDLVSCTGKKRHLLLSHSSVKEFLTSSKIKHSQYAAYGFHECEAHTSIAESCIAYIFHWCSSPQKSVTEKDLDVFPLLGYACRYWFEHVRNAKEQPRLADQALKLLRSEQFKNYALMVFNPISPGEQFSCGNFTLASPLDWAVVLGLESVVDLLLQSGKEDINKIQSSIFFTLEKHHFRSHQHKEYCDGTILMSVMPHREPGTLLMKAVFFNHWNIVKLLIDNGADIHIKEPENNATALSLACEHKQGDMVKILLDNGANPNEETLPLNLAASTGNKEIAELLLKHGALVNGSDPTDDTPLMSAAMTGGQSMCEFLLNNGADINLKSNYGRDDPDARYDNALSAATSLGNLLVVKFLLGKGAHISLSALMYSLTGNYYDGPSEESQKICEMFVQHGADLDRNVDENHDTPLALALRNGWYDIAKLMLDKGARVDPGDSTCLTAGNILAAAISNVDMTNYILKRGIDANAPVAFVDSWAYEHEDRLQFATALQAAAYYQESETVGLLLGQGADANAHGTPWGHPLNAACAAVADWRKSAPELPSVIEKARGICELLLKNGARWIVKCGSIEYENLQHCAVGYKRIYGKSMRLHKYCQQPCSSKDCISLFTSRVKHPST